MFSKLLQRSYYRDHREADLKARKNQREGQFLDQRAEKVVEELCEKDHLLWNLKKMYQMNRLKSQEDCLG